MKTECMYCGHEIESKDEEARMHLDPNTCLWLLKADNQEMKAKVRLARQCLGQVGRALTKKDGTRKEALEILKQVYKRISDG